MRTAILHHLPTTAGTRKRARQRMAGFSAAPKPLTTRMLAFAAVTIFSAAFATFAFASK